MTARDHALAQYQRKIDELEKIFTESIAHARKGGALVNMRNVELADLHLSQGVGYLKRIFET